MLTAFGAAFALEDGFAAGVSLAEVTMAVGGASSAVQSKLMMLVRRDKTR